MNPGGMFIVHTHKKGFKRSCKFWLEPEVMLNQNKTGDFSEIELNEIKSLVVKHEEIIRKQLELFYNNKPVRAIRL